MRRPTGRSVVCVTSAAGPTSLVELFKTAPSHDEPATSRRAGRPWIAPAEPWAAPDIQGESEGAFAQAGCWAILVCDGEQEESPGKVVPLTKPVFAIGRKETCQLRIDDAAVSSVHCKLHRSSPTNDTQSTCTVSDESSNGTFVNGVRIAKGVHVELKDLDQIGLLKPSVRASGSTEESPYLFLFRTRPPAPPPPPPQKVSIRGAAEVAFASALGAVKKSFGKAEAVAAATSHDQERYDAFGDPIVRESDTRAGGQPRATLASKPPAPSPPVDQGASSPSFRSAPQGPPREAPRPFESDRSTALCAPISSNKERAKVLASSLLEKYGSRQDDGSIADVMSLEVCNLMAHLQYT